MTATTDSAVGVLGLRAGDRVVVRGEAEILASLDEKGELDSLPFMPEMLRFCGQPMTVRKVAVKACDTVSSSGLRRMNDAVHLDEARCDGSAHGGCENACSLYWKEAWLQRVDGAERQDAAADDGSSVLLRERLEPNTRKEPGPDGEERFSCQATELLRAAPERVPFKDLGQYVRDIRTGNAKSFSVLRSFLVAFYDRLQRLSTRFLPRWLRVRGGRAWGRPRGRVAGRTPTTTLDLQPGELVRIRSRRAIEDTLNADLQNRGLGFDAEMARHCGREAQVVRRIEKVIDEKTGRLLHMKTPCVVLDGIICEGAYNANCPRAWICFWREIWLERVNGPGT